MKKFISIILSVTLPLFLFSQMNSNSYKLMENAYVNMNSVSLSLDNQFTVMGWMKWDTNPIGEVNWSSIVTETNNVDDEYIQFIIQSNADFSKLEFGLQLESVSDNMWSDGVMKEGEWFHFAAICNGNQQKLYINGVEKSGKMSTGRSSSFQADFSLSLSSMAAWNFAQSFDGAVDKVSVWEKALTQEEILILMTSETPPNNSGLVSYYSIDEVNNNIMLNENVYSHVTISDDSFRINTGIIADKSISCAQGNPFLSK